MPKGKNQSPSPGIGKTGNTENMKSSEGGQWPHLPPASSHGGRMEHSKESGQNQKVTRTNIPWLPSKPE